MIMADHIGGAGSTWSCLERSTAEAVPQQVTAQSHVLASPY
jgi:hypothetical protein